MVGDAQKLANVENAMHCTATRESLNETVAF